MHIRVVRFTDVTADRVASLLARVESEGPPPGETLCAPRAALAAVAALELALDRERALSLRAGLLQSACGLNAAEIGELLGLGPRSVCREVRRHWERVRAEADYLELTATVLHPLVAQR